MKINKLNKKLNESYDSYIVDWVNNKIVWHLPGGKYTYSGYTKEEYNIWNDKIINVAGYGPKNLSERKMFYNNFQEQYKLKKTKNWSKWEKRKEDNDRQEIEDTEDRNERVGKLFQKNRKH